MQPSTGFSSCPDEVINIALLQLQLEQIQSRLLDVGSAVATPMDSSSESKLKRVQFDAASTSQLEVRVRVPFTRYSDYCCIASENAQLHVQIHLLEMDRLPCLRLRDPHRENAMPDCLSSSGSTLH